MFAKAAAALSNLQVSSDYGGIWWLGAETAAPAAVAEAAAPPAPAAPPVAAAAAPVAPPVAAVSPLGNHSNFQLPPKIHF